MRACTHCARSGLRIIATSDIVCTRGVSRGADSRRVAVPLWSRLTSDANRMSVAAAFLPRLTLRGRANGAVVRRGRCAVPAAALTPCLRHHDARRAPDAPLSSRSRWRARLVVAAAAPKAPRAKPQQRKSAPEPGACTRVRRLAVRQLTLRPLTDGDSSWRLFDLEPYQRRWEARVFSFFLRPIAATSDALQRRSLGARPPSSWASAAGLLASCSRACCLRRSSQRCRAYLFASWLARSKASTSPQSRPGRRCKASASSGYACASTSCRRICSISIGAHVAAHTLTPLS